MNRPGSGVTSGLFTNACPFVTADVTDAPLQDDQQTEDFRENRDAFEQEQRQVGRAADLCRRTRLTRDALGHAGGQLANAEAGADDDQSETDPGSGVTPDSIPPCVRLPPETNVSDAREWPCR